MGKADKAKDDRAMEIVRQIRAKGRTVKEEIVSFPNDETASYLKNLRAFEARSRTVSITVK